MTEQFVPMTRRGLMGTAAAAGLVLAGCGGDNSQKGAPVTSEGTPSGPRKKGGTLRFGDDGMSGTTSADVQSSSTEFLLTRAFADNLIERGHDYKLRLGLAEVFEPEGNDFQVWTIRVRDGIEFHDGKTLGADDVIYTIKRNLNPKAPGFTSGLMASIDPKRMKKMDERTVRLHLKYPNSQLRDGFGEIPSAIVPVNFDPKKPIGTGPFKQESFTPQRRWVGVRNENYWKDGKPYLDRLELIGFASQNARVNAMISGQVDAMDIVPAAQVNQLKSHPNINVVISETGQYNQVEMSLAKGSPFQDARVRMAFKLMVDRQQLLNSIYGGLGGIGNDTGTWAQFDPSYPSDLPQRQQDLEQARSLLKAAGHEGMTVPIRLGEIAPGIFATGDVLAQQAKAIGATIKPNRFTDIAQFYGSNAYYTSPLKIDFDYTQTVYDNLSYLLLPGAPFNNTFYDNPQIDKLHKEALATDGAAYNAKIAEIARIIRDDGPWVVWGRRNLVDALSKKFTGLVPDNAGTGFNGYYLDEISLA